MKKWPNSKYSIICRLPGSNSFGLFSNPDEVSHIYMPQNLLPALTKVESATKEGKFVAGFISYEAAPAFDEAHSVIDDSSDFPLAFFAFYSDPPKLLDLNNLDSDSTPQQITTQPELTKNDYLGGFEEVKRYIYDGDIYQANYTFRSFSSPLRSPGSFFATLCQRHPTPYAAFIDLGNLHIVSLSPELFLERRGKHISSLPMKGTASRSPIPEIDQAIARNLSLDSKNRAENVMIVDMVRNDLGRICESGSVKVDPLFHVDTYQTIHQMVSGVSGKLYPKISLGDILSATFPAASITGAPKIRAMEIIAELEKSPRKVYTGTIGCFMPNGDFCLNVAIRTLICRSEKVELGIGSAVVADSDPIGEWEESLLKSRFCSRIIPEFDTLETILWSRKDGFSFLEEHLERSRSSQLYFGRPWNNLETRKCLERLEFPPNVNLARVRLRIDRNGHPSAEFAVLDHIGWDNELLKIKLSKHKTDSNDLFLHHKTTNREFYNTEFKKAISEGYDEVIFSNQKGELTEGAISNIFILREDRWETPRLSSGLLPGIWREKMIKSLDANEKNLSFEDVINAEKILIGNSVRGTGNGKTG